MLCVWSLLSGPGKRLLRGYRSRRYLCYGSALALASLFFFVLGLEDNVDKFRIMHSVWHVLSGAGSYFLFRAGMDDPYHMSDENGRKEEKKSS